nr:uncharacterized protein LOC109176388 [Ipomoea trifida]
MELLLQMEVPRMPPPQKRATVKPIKPEAVIVINPDTKEEVKEKNSLRRKVAAEDSSRKTYTATLTARSKAACGLNIKLPMEKIEDIDAGDVYNELAVVEYAEDMYKFYKEAEANHLCIRHLQDMILCGGSDSVIILTGVGGFIACRAVRALSQRNNEPTRASRPWDSVMTAMGLSWVKELEFCFWKNLSMRRLGKGNQELAEDMAITQHSRNRRIKGGTLIVCPMALLGQWKDELEAHSKPDSISVFVHYGGDISKP